MASPFSVPARFARRAKQSNLRPRRPERTVPARVIKSQDILREALTSFLETG